MLCGVEELADVGSPGAGLERFQQGILGALVESPVIGLASVDLDRLLQRTSKESEV